MHGAGWAQPLVVEVDGGGEELLHRLHPACVLAPEDVLQPSQRPNFRDDVGKIEFPIFVLCPQYFLIKCHCVTVLMPPFCVFSARCAGSPVVVAIARLPQASPSAGTDPSGRRPSLTPTKAFGAHSASSAVGHGERVVLAAALPDCEAAGVVCHRRHSNGNRDGPQLPNGRSDESEGDQDNIAQLEGAVANGTAGGSSAGDSDAGVLRVSRFFAEEHHLASGDRVQLKPLAKQALTLNRAVLVARTQSAYRFATKKGTCYCFHTHGTLTLSRHLCFY